MQGVNSAENKSAAAVNPLWNSRFKKYAFADGLSEELCNAFRDTESLLMRSELIKNSRSTTAGIFSLMGKKYFIKRSNALTFPERLRRLGRMSRAQRNALMAVELEKLNVRTPKVLMTLSTDGAILPGASYLITECFESPVAVNHNLEPLLEYYGSPQELFAALCRLAVKLHNGGFFHGDLKMSNILSLRQADGSFELGVFDLDGSWSCKHPLPERLRCRELARMASSYFLCALRKKLVSREDCAAVIGQWAAAYCAAGGCNYEENPVYLRRVKKFLSAYNVL